MGEWKEYTLGELVNNFDGQRVPIRGADRQSGNYPYYGASGIVDYVNSYIFDGDYLLIAEDGENLRTRNTPIAFLAKGKFWVNNHAHILQGNLKADTRFLMYALQSMDISGYLTGSTMPKLTQGNMNRIPIFAPELKTQRRIAHILGTLDDKIELNRKMNETLEAMAQAIFKSWFIDFDPVKAKGHLAGKYHGDDMPRGRAEKLLGQMDPEVVKLFPEDFEDSELGRIPRGWKIYKLGNLIELAYGKALKEEDRLAGNIPVYGSNGQVGFHNEKLVSGPGIIVGRKGNPGTVTWSPTDFFSIDTTFYVVPKNRYSSPYLLYHILRNHHLSSLSADSAVPGLNRNQAYMNKQSIPPQDLENAFGLIVKKLFSLIYRNEIESEIITTQREILLPKLMKQT